MEDDYWAFVPRRTVVLAAVVVPVVWGMWLVGEVEVIGLEEVAERFRLRASWIEIDSGRGALLEASKSYLLKVECMSMLEDHHFDAAYLFLNLCLLMVVEVQILQEVDPGKRQEVLVLDDLVRARLHLWVAG